VRVAGELALGLALLLAVRAFMQRGVASGAAPALAGRDLAGRAVSLADFRGRPVMVHFWATWCGVCRVQEPSVEAMARDHTVLTVATSSGEARAIRAAMDQRGLTFPVVVDEEGDIARAWGVRQLPTSFFVADNQRIRTAETGLTSSLGLRARMWLASW
jgi:thiol-disulfide isomerase/thioredoxin